MNRIRDWKADSSIPAAAFYITTSASAGRPCENPCARECRCFSSTLEGMGSAMANRTSMRRWRGCDRHHTTNQWFYNRCWKSATLSLFSLRYSNCLAIRPISCTNPKEGSYVTGCLKKWMIIERKTNNEILKRKMFKFTGKKIFYLQIIVFYLSIYFSILQISHPGTQRTTREL